jgi:hypothetical protein
LSSDEETQIQPDVVDLLGTRRRYYSLFSLGYLNLELLMKAKIETIARTFIRENLVDGKFVWPEHPAKVDGSVRHKEDREYVDSPRTMGVVKQFINEHPEVVKEVEQQGPHKKPKW